MRHFAVARMISGSRRCTTFAAIAGLSFTLTFAHSAHGQVASAPAPSTVSLNQAAFLPVLSEGSIKTTIATNFGGEASASPWQISLLSLSQNDNSGGQTYRIQMTNMSTGTLSLPVGANGQAIWDTCRKEEIAEVNFSLRISGQALPAANLPATHSCAGVPSSSMAVAPGASVVFQGALPASFKAAQDAGISAAVTVCSSNYQLDSNSTTRRCQVPVVSPALVSPIHVASASSRVK